jgi:hypothetical protein
MIVDENFSGLYLYWRRKHLCYAFNKRKIGLDVLDKEQVSWLLII